MSSNDIPHKCKQRFKGVESFLRRIAFNLGNSPSQTEVKIISCIPIDVTDLQQKIACLEKQLEATRVPECDSPSRPASVVQTALCPSRHSAPAPADGCSVALSCKSPAVHSCAPKPPSCACWSSASDHEVCSPECKRGIFKKQKKKKDKCKKKCKSKTHFVYYAQTTNGPFGRYASERRVANARDRVEETVNGSYISDVIRKQYIPVPMVRDYSVESEFSSPVCRDADPRRSRWSPHDSDVCSCCHGPFQNIDHQMPRHTIPEEPQFPTYPANECVINTSFYDTTLYDMIPVRERPKAYDNPRRKSPSNNISASYYPERKRSKTRVHPYAVTNYCRVQTTPNQPRTTPMRTHSRKEKPRRESPKRENIKEKIRPTETSDSCCIDCGNVYMKRVINKVQEPVKPIVTTSHKNAECLTNSLNDTECQTTTTQSVQIDQELLEEKKTEETLNQIKTILQSVLTEVKTNTQLKKIPEDKSTKDAVVQKGPSQGNMPGCSTLLHSYTYSPYNMNPYQASCSRQMTSGPCCFPTMPYTSGKCMHNYPVFIQTPPRHMCPSCFRNSSHIPKVGQAKHAATTATNTESKERSKETEKLIKEIYKSMAVNMEFPAKETSASEYNDVRSTPRGSVNRSLYRASVLDQGMKNFVKANTSRQSQRLVSRNAQKLKSLDDKLMSNTMSTRSQIVSTTDTERRLRNHRLENYLETVEAQKRQNKIVEEREYEATPETTGSDEEVSSSDSDERVKYTRAEEPAKKTEAIQKTEPPKRGLFSKMFKSVKLFSNKGKKKEEQIQVENEDDEESENSDDYQTVYSHRMERAPRYIPYPVRAVRSPARLKTHSKISYSRHIRDRNQERSRRSPYMEQEYRRHWNEKLMFHEDQYRYSSEGQHSKNAPRRPVYWQNYEARSALVARRPNVPRQANVQKILRSEAPRLDLRSSSPRFNAGNKGLAWLKKHKLGINCGPQWKKLILEG